MRNANELFQWRCHVLKWQTDNAGAWDGIQGQWSPNSWDSDALLTRTMPLVRAGLRPLLLGSFQQNDKLPRTIQPVISAL